MQVFVRDNDVNSALRILKEKNAVPAKKPRLGRRFDAIRSLIGHV